MPPMKGQIDNWTAFRASRSSLADPKRFVGSFCNSFCMMSSSSLAHDSDVDRCGGSTVSCL